MKKVNKANLNAGDKKNTAGGSWSAGFAKTGEGFWLWQE
jgi:hypothetical protein